MYPVELVHFGRPGEHHYYSPSGFDEGVLDVEKRWRSRVYLVGLWRGVSGMKREGPVCNPRG